MRTDEMLKVQDMHDDLMAEIVRLRTVVRDLLESYLATFDGNKDDLALRAEALLGNEQTVTEK